MKSKDLEEVLQIILRNVEEGIHVIDQNGKTVLYNQAMADLEHMSVKEVLNKPFRQVFKNMDEKESTLLQALIHGTSSTDKNQIYRNKAGKEITAINTTTPIEIQGELRGAIEISRNITKIQEMSNVILDLQEHLIGPQKSKEKKMLRYRFHHIVGESPTFKHAIEMAKKAAKNNASVFIYGETGTGKELFAQSIHYDGARRESAFLAQNCAALPDTLLEGILFGTSKGGFTGAIDRAGLFEQANKGTLLLDEINSMPLETQAKLLRVLQENYIRRVGGTKDVPVDVRIIATSNEDPEVLLSTGKIRKDLFYRLNILALEIPPLRRRREDIPLLANRFLSKYNEKYGKKVWSISATAMDKLMAHNYPGNIRELENIIMNALAMVGEENILESQHITINLYGNNRLKASIYNLDYGLDHYLADQEKAIIEDSLMKNQGNITRTAKELKLLRQTLQHKMRKYHIKNLEESYY